MSKSINIKIFFFIIFTLFNHNTFAFESWETIGRKVLKVQNKAVMNMMRKPHHKYDHWNFTYTMGTSYTSQYYLVFKWLGHKSPSLDVEKLKKKLLETQSQTDGAWQTVKRHDFKGELNATILNYFALKVMGEDVNGLPLKKARKWILKNGGIDSASFDVKLLLAIFNNYLWSNLLSVPRSFLLIDNFAQFVNPNFYPIAFLRGKEPRKYLGPKYGLLELYLKAPKKLKHIAQDIGVLKTSHFNPSMMVKRSIVEVLLDCQRNNGSFGGYGSSTSLALMVLHSYKTIYIDLEEGHNTNEGFVGAIIDNIEDFVTRRFYKESRSEEKIQQAMKMGFDFIEKVVFQANEEHRYEGILSDGHIWDTALSIQALAANNVTGEFLTPYGDYLERTKADNGGFPFGVDLLLNPDNDDTAEAVLALHAIDPVRYEKTIDDAVAWMFSMQSKKDGGFAAFSRSNYGKSWVKYVLNYANFAEVDFFYDVPTPDVTGHVLEALGVAGHTYANNENVRRAVDFLKDQQVPTSNPMMWKGRWGINYLYGTSAALVGLHSVGVTESTPMVKNALQWLIKRQNQDGGWGEDSLSYENSRYAGVGKSTPTQTAWALLPLIEYGYHKEKVVKKGLEYLVSQFNTDGKWTDLSATGTGAPKMIYMDYNSYEYTFPLIAIGRYLNKLKEEIDNF
jgi:squalene-hopene/tetraprenyl-beta-curcumene cyclase